MKTNEVKNRRKKTLKLYLFIGHITGEASYTRIRLPMKLHKFSCVSSFD